MVRISGLDPQNEIASNIVPSRSLSQNVFFNVGPTTHSVCLFVCSPLGLHCTRTPFLTFSRSSLSSFQPIILYHSSLSTKILRFFCSYTNAPAEGALSLRLHFVASHAAALLSYRRLYRSHEGKRSHSLL